MLGASAGQQVANFSHFLSDGGSAVQMLDYMGYV